MDITAGFMNPNLTASADLKLHPHRTVGVILVVTHETHAMRIGIQRGDSMKGTGSVRMVAVYILVFSLFLAVAYWTGIATTTIAQMIPMERGYTVVIDPGHGGVDGGATSCTGVLESQFNLEISLRLRDLFHLLGYRTKMIRTEDISVYTSGETIAAKKVSDLRARVRIVEESENPILVSIHQNTFSDSRYHGPQVFYGTKGEGEQLAKKLQERLTASLNPGSNRMAKKAEGIYLMQHIHCTGVLVECGFLSNPEEEGKLRNRTYQNQLSCVIASTVANFLDG